MITVSAAKELIRSSVTPLPSVKRPLGQAAGFVLAEDVYATVDIPAFVQSSMDGYAIRFADKELLLNITGEMAAGTPESFSIKTGEAARIFTGAPLPEGADTVVMQEKVSVTDGQVRINDDELTQGLNSRGIGSEIRKGELALRAGSTLTPAAVGFLAGIGVRLVSVYSMPSASILITGNELQTPGEPLGPGQVYEANSFSLSAALRKAGVSNIQVINVEDRLDSVKHHLAGVLEWTDVVLLTGGVSVGDYDYVAEAAKLNGVQQIFHRVKQKPGKPLYFGMKGRVPVFGLPGNPSSVLSCFYHYVLEAIAGLTRLDLVLKTRVTVLESGYRKPAGVTQFLKGNLVENADPRSPGLAGEPATPNLPMVRILGAQDSYRLSSFAGADCLVCLEEGREEYREGERVNVFLL